jgi:hypothetical protein
VFDVTRDVAILVDESYGSISKQIERDIYGHND